MAQTLGLLRDPGVPETEIIAKLRSWIRCNTELCCQMTELCFNFSVALRTVGAEVATAVISSQVGAPPCVCVRLSPPVRSRCCSLA